ncbi:MAG: AMP-binding protein [Sphingomonadales bacterium]|nr:AMP-binding protein [Sphingomonadales bacterium]
MDQLRCARNLIVALPNVAEVSVIAVLDDKWGERHLALIAPHPGHVVALASVNGIIDDAVARGELSDFAHIDRIETLDSLPKTSVGKIDKKLLREWFASPPD